jgi:hypothetical protein
VPSLDLKAELFLAANDPTAGELRRDAVRAVAAALGGNGQRLEFHHWLDGSRAGFGFALAARMAGQLCTGAAITFDAGVVYAGAGSVRQLIEVTYLLNVMAHDEQEAEAWVRATHDEIVGSFMPRHLRKRSVRTFRASQYATHCDRGGHPNPAGANLLGLRSGDTELEGMWCDLAEHAAEAWTEFCSGLDRYDPRRQVADSLYSPWRSPDNGTIVNEAVARWRAEDPLLRVDVRPPAA